MAFQRQTLVMHLRGNFRENMGKIEYLGEEQTIWDIDPDVVSYHVLCDMVKDSGGERVEVVAVNEGKLDGERVEVGARNKGVGNAENQSEETVHEGVDNVEKQNERVELGNDEGVNVKVESVAQFVNVKVVEARAYDGNDDDAELEDEEDPFRDFGWVSENECEEFQEIRDNYNKYKEDKSNRKV
ncbi:hypothetical protein PTKIN_Ptkin06aG0053200 [Pterospermum kingtungense]